MSAYTFRIPGDYHGDYLKLIPGRDYRKSFNLSSPGRTTNLEAWSIQAIASSVVKVKVWISNMLTVPFFNDSEHWNWTEPVQTPSVGNLWIPSTSIPEFVISPGQNYFTQGEMLDTAQFLMFQLMPDFPTDSKHILDSAGNPVEEIAFSLALTFR